MKLIRAFLLTALLVSFLGVMNWRVSAQNAEKDRNVPTRHNKATVAARLGVTRVGLSGFTNVSTPQPVLDAFEGAVQALENAGATVVDLDAAGFTFSPAVRLV